MGTDEQIRDIFKKNRTIAVVGMSRNMQKPSNWIPVFFLSRNFKIVPVNPYAGRIKGLRSYPDLRDIPDRINILMIFRPEKEAESVVRTAVDRHRGKGDIDVIWLQEGRSEAAAQIAEAEGITFIQGRCMYREYKRLTRKK
ncbi:MAG TPA: CoA-binding protein [Syntrophales bacterium]|nr:CoA-binding protein [Syntrophales bacterium]